MGVATTSLCMSDATARGDLEEYEQFIGGSFTESTADERIEVRYPYTGEVWATAPAGTADDVDRAVAAARDAFEDPSWQDIQPTERAEMLEDIADVCEEYGDELGELETKQNGKLLSEMQAGTGGMAEWFRYYAAQARTEEGRVVPVEMKDGQVFNFVQHEPLGVVGAITPWNTPLLLSVFKIAPALATGNTFVHKPSEITPVSALRFAELIYEHTDLPEGVYNVVTGYGEPAGAALSSHENIDKVAFTGGVETGRIVGRAAGGNLVPVTLELGGKSPNIIFPSADFENAVRGALKGIFAATGQSCMAGSRILVHEDVHDEFVETFVERASQIEMGDPMDPTTQMAPVAFDGQYETVMEYIELGVEEGATLEFGGDTPEDLPGDLFIRPTIMTDVDNDMTVAQEEIFGPVASVIPFSDETEALEIANDTDYGLGAGVWTDDTSQAFRMANGLNAGNVWINEYRLATWNTPSGGMGDSGIGRENGQEALEEYRTSKSIYLDTSGEVPDPFVYKPS
jgi:acyl-CoA reductase-like NAD-dependent aldehyde dehydrogenase